MCACGAGAGMFSFGNGKYEEAAELYGQAAKQYQLGKNCESSRALRSIRETESTASRPTDGSRVEWAGLRSLAAVEKAAGCYELAVEMHSKLGSFLECAMAYKEAGSMFEKADRPNGASHRALPPSYRIVLGNTSQGGRGRWLLLPPFPISWRPYLSLPERVRWCGVLSLTRYRDAKSIRGSAECCRCLDEAKSLYAQEGRLSECAKLAKRRAEIFEKAEIIDLMLESYAEAAELFDGEDQKGETRNCKLKIAHYKALIEEKDAICEAIEIYEDVAKESLESNLLKWSVKQYYLKALLAALVLAANQLGKTVDDVREKRAEYCSLDATFEETREDNLIVGCIDAIEEGDLEAFATACNEFDEITKLDSWQTTLLLRAKNGIDNPLGDDGEQEDDIC